MYVDETESIVTSSLMGVRSIVVSICVCLSLVYLKYHMCKVDRIICTRYLWPWLGPHLTPV